MILNLPKELQVYILSHFTDLDDVYNLSYTCKDLYKLIHTNGRYITATRVIQFNNTGVTGNKILDINNCGSFTIYNPIYAYYIAGIISYNEIIYCEKKYILGVKSMWIVWFDQTRLIRLMYLDTTTDKYYDGLNISYYDDFYEAYYVLNIITNNGSVYKNSPFVRYRINN